MNTLGSIEVVDGEGAEGCSETPCFPRVTTADFHARQMTLLLSDTERAAIAARPRFYSMPWVRFSNAYDPDDTLP